ncbi:MAG: hydroxymethylbilane synthase [Chloroflexi bacterium]|nr:hydroxymethylbilane synthase [Chloroflexota bacterium]MCI0799131.1 hydroxymethylbilane synthase [Chloroflexota bacterium]MCI0824950.1 hydroxymethylbilane synthase [Chloroflexota bacterium]MCI0879687.1 hydroxymethylbilane synthase [Chloroflexota bacterium]MCI0894678.1 hydroxymethylbilane synthase [Chloroflexota bacterium]
MAQGKVIKVGTRGSDLALRQTEEVLDALRPIHPDLDFQVVTVRTQGDANPDKPLAGMGLGIFVKEIERLLIGGDLDMAVHSLKDLPTLLPEGLVLGALLKRQDPRDVLVNRWNCRLGDLPQGARIGTSSPRRRAQLQNLCPQVTVLPIRGNVDTRLRKAQGEEYDGAVLAAAGLIRLGLTEHVAEYLSAQRFVPPPGQGVLAVEVRADDYSMVDLLRPIDHTETRLAATAERAFLEKLGGGCQIPVGAYARAVEDILLLTVFLSSPDGKKAFRCKVEGLALDPLQLASDAYLAVVERGGGPLLEVEWSEMTPC